LCLQIGIIGGTGLDDPDILENYNETYLTTPFGCPSDVLIEGKIGGVSCVLLARYKLRLCGSVSQLVSSRIFVAEVFF
jgi:5'-methylthioadenosine phosphorylase